MTDDEKAVGVSITGRGDGGLTRTVRASTPADQPDVVVHAVPWYVVVLTRTAQVYVQSFLGFVGATGVGATVGLIEAGNVFVHAAELAIYPTVVAVLTNALVFLTKFNERAPRWTA